MADDWKDKKITDTEIVNAALNRMARDAASSGRTLADGIDDEDMARLMLDIYNNHKDGKIGMLGQAGNLTAGLVLPMLASSTAATIYPTLKTTPSSLGAIEGLANMAIGYGTAKNEGRDYTSADATADMAVGMLGQAMPTILEGPFTKLANEVANRGLAKFGVGLTKGATTTGVNALTPDAVAAIRQIFPEEELYGGD